MNYFINTLKNIFDSNHNAIEVFQDLSKFIMSIWNYCLFTTSNKEKILISNLVIGIILLVIGFKVVKRVSLIIKKKLKNILSEEGAVSSLDKLIYYFLLMLMVVFVLDISKVPLTVFTVIGTTLALGVGLGSQNIVNNFISGIIIMIERPIKVGDIIEVKNVVGEVINIGARCTSIKTSNNINMLIPNSNILQDVIVNWTLEDTILKMSLKLTLEDKAIDVIKIDNIILEVLKEHPNILKSPVPQILVTNLCMNGCDIEIDFWIDLSKGAKSKLIINDVNRALIPVLRENKIGVLDRVLYSSQTAEAIHH